MGGGEREEAGTDLAEGGDLALRPIPAEAEALEVALDQDTVRQAAGDTHGEPW